MTTFSGANPILDTSYDFGENSGMDTERPKQERLQAPTKPELADRFANQVTVLSRKVDRKRKLGKGPLLNAIATWFLEQPVEEQVRIANEGMRLYADIPGEEVRGSARPETVLVEASKGLPGALLKSDGNRSKAKSK